jgi:hypothetical protein
MSRDTVARIIYACMVEVTYSMLNHQMWTRFISYDRTRVDMCAIALNSLIQQENDIWQVLFTR